MTRIFGHRGAPDHLPENTLEGFRFAIDSGADGLELDVFISRDGVPVVTHNPRLMADTTRDAAGNWLAEEGPAIAALTFDELQQFDVGGIRPDSAYADKHPQQTPLPGARIPSLAQVLELAASVGRDLELLIELKHSPTAAGQRKMGEFVSLAAAEIHKAGLGAQSYLHAFNWQILAAAAEAAPGLRRSHLSIRRGTHADGTVYPGSPWLAGMSHQTADMLPQLAATGAAVWSPYSSDLDAVSLAQAQDLGLQVMTWTVNGREALAAELARGVDGIITDDPKLAVALRAAGAMPSREGQPA